MTDLLITAVHLIAAIYASWRLTELVVMDKISDPIRKRFPIYFFTCHRCVSVWAGLAALLIYHFFPWGNWPLALSWIYLQHRDWKVRTTEGRRLIVLMTPDNAMTLVRSELTQPELDFLGQQIQQGTVKAVAA